MHRLADLARRIGGKLRQASGDELIGRVCYDSRQAQSGDIFVAIAGFKADGAKFAAEAWERGARAIVCDDGSARELRYPLIVVENPRAALAKLAWFLAGEPQNELTLIGVTGTNGKTTVTAALAHLLSLCGKPTGVCGTLGMFFEDYRFDTDRTTAEAPELAAAFRSMQSAGATHIALEATSIGLELNRLDELRFQAAVFTNLSRDHLDFHGTWDAYRNAKMRLFESERLAGTAIVNADDPESMHFIRHTARPSLAYGIDSECDFRATGIRLRANGTEFTLCTPDGGFEAHTSLIGRFNVYNTLAIVAAAYALNVPVATAAGYLPKIAPVRGRAEVVRSTAPFAVLVDYAHTPDALEKILSTVRDLTDGRLVCVIGAGGDRDRGKRPLMAAAAEKWSDTVILTSDNPRSEFPEAIVDEMRAGIIDTSKLRMIVERREAIYHSLATATAGDVIVVAGKGHETYQEIKGVKHPFDDAQVVREWLLSHGFAE